jgi:hypothetical protein
MASYIFLKSLRSLEEFRKKILMSKFKIPPKSPSTIFQSLAITKNQILFGKEFFLHIRPNRPSGQPAHPASPPGQPHRPPLFSRRPHARARPILACTALAYLPKAVSSLSLRSPATTPSLSVTAKRAPPVSSIFHLAPADPSHAATSAHLSRPPHATQPLPLDAESRSLLPRLDSPELTPLLNLPRSSMALMA